jgi:putative protease
MAEILAPVGAFDMLLAAVRCSADAVYLGGKTHNARAKTEGFAGEELVKAVRYCHERSVRVFYTLNTLLFDEELDDAQAEISAVASAGVDAIIVQDLAVLEMIKNTVPDMPLHASTQMSVHNLFGAKLIESLGFSRVVLAREMSRDEIKAVIDGTNLETEVFVHGAFCMSVSGQCYLSSMLGGRSGNRGRCAQPCRLPFDSGLNSHALSLKDNSLVARARELSDLGITSLKIEGRQKRPEYVAAVVTELRKALSGEAPNEEMLRSVFSRNGFTDGYWTGVRGQDMFGHRTKEDAASAKDTFSALRALYKDEKQVVPVDICFVMKKDEPVILTVSDGVRKAEAVGAVPEQARTAPLTEEKIAKNIAKLGGTPYYVRDLAVDVDEGLMLPVSSLNELRRNAVAKLAEARICWFISARAKSGHMAEEMDSGTKAGMTDKLHMNDYGLRPLALRVRLRSVAQLTENVLEEASEIVLPAAEILKGASSSVGAGVISSAIAEGKLFCEMPALLFDEDSASETLRLQKVQKLGITDFITGNLYGLEVAKELGVVVHGDYGLNITNLSSLWAFAELGLASATLSFELNASRVRNISFDAPINVGVIAYGKLPLMRFRNCPECSPLGLPKGSDLREGILTDRMNKKWTIVSEDGGSALLNSVPLNITDRLVSFGELSTITLYFTDEKAGEIEKIVNNAKRGTLPRGERTAGLYFRNVE